MSNRSISEIGDIVRVKLGEKFFEGKIVGVNTADRNHFINAASWDYIVDVSGAVMKLKSDQIFPLEQPKEETDGLWS